MDKLDPSQKPLTPAFVSSILASPSKLSIVAVVCVFLALLLPAVTISNLMGRDTSFIGTQAAGISAWLSLLVYLGAALTRYNVGITRYRSQIDLAAFLMFPITLIWVFQRLHLSNHNYSPSLGFVLFALAPVALFLARQREQTA